MYTPAQFPQPNGHRSVVKSLVPVDDVGEYSVIIDAVPPYSLSVRSRHEDIPFGEVSIRIYFC